MNLIELENIVKAAPDDYLVKEVQQPTGKVPPFLALSEIQRRKDMRDRYLAQKNEGAKPTIAEQLVGGIGSLGGEQAPQGAPIPTPSATGIPSAGAPPVAAGAAPMPTPPGIPQGFAAGGLVGYADGGGTAYKESMRKYWQQNFPSLYDIANDFTLEGRQAQMASNKAMLERLKRERIASSLSGEIKDAFLSATHQGYAQDPAFYEREKAKSARMAFAKNNPNGEYLLKPEYQPASPAPDYLRQAPAQSAPAAGTDMSAPLPAPVPASSGAGEAYVATPGGIGSIDPNQAISGAGPAVNVPAPAQAAVAGAPGIPNPYNASPEELELQQYLKNEENFKLPEALNYQAFIDEAMGEEQKIREEAKRQAIGAALVQLGAGLAMGDMAKGFTTAGAESRDILSQGRKEASAQRAVAQQFKLQGMQGERDAKLKQMEMDIKRTESLATLVGGNRRDAESRAMDIARMQQDAAQHAASIGIQSAQLGLSRERAELEKKQGAIQFMESLIDTSVGKPPNQSTLDAWAIASRTNPKTAGPNPMDVYMAQRAAAAKLAAPKVEQVYGVPAQNLYVEAVKPVSNPPGKVRKFNPATGKLE